MKRIVATIAAALGLAVAWAGIAFAAPPSSFPGQGTEHAHNAVTGGHCHIVVPASEHAPFTVVNPSPHAGGHAHGAPFLATAC